jgi:histidinol dehydrogenase
MDTVNVATTSEKLIDLVQVELEKQLEALPRKEIAEISLNNSTCAVSFDGTLH